MSEQSQTNEVEQLMLNAQLRTEMEPFLDESVDLLNLRQMTTPRENEFLASMLAWEKAPVLPIFRWFNPEMSLPHPDSLSDEKLKSKLDETISRLYDVQIVLEFTEHLNDRELYTLIYRDILPSSEKKVDLPKNYLHWHCIDDENDEDTWLRYYASEYDRQSWKEETGMELPPAENPPYKRRMPRRP